jgi:hypothetical protein
MIQRIQTLYLIVTLIIISLLLIFPYGYFTSSDTAVYQLNHGGLIKLTDNKITQIYFNYAVTILVSIAISLDIYGIIQYKNRKKQISHCKALIYILLIISGSLFWLFFKTTSSFEHSKMSWVIFTPIIAILPTYMAMKAIKKDEELVQSADRLR